MLWFNLFGEIVVFFRFVSFSKLVVTGRTRKRVVSFLKRSCCSFICLVRLLFVLVCTIFKNVLIEKKEKTEKEIITKTKNKFKPQHMPTK